MDQSSPTTSVPTSSTTPTTTAPVVKGANPVGSKPSKGKAKAPAKKSNRKKATPIGEKVDLIDGDVCAIREEVEQLAKTTKQVAAEMRVLSGLKDEISALVAQLKPAPPAGAPTPGTSASAQPAASGPTPTAGNSSHAPATPIASASPAQTSSNLVAAPAAPAPLHPEIAELYNALRGPSDSSSCMPSFADIEAELSTGDGGGSKALSAKEKVLARRLGETLWLRNANSMVFLVNERVDTITQDPALSSFIKVVEKDTVAFNGSHPHPRAALWRSIATLHAFKAMYQEGVRHVCLMWWSPRDIRIINDLNKNVPKAQQLRYCFYGDNHDAKDNTRGRVDKGKELDSDPVFTKLTMLEDAAGHGVDAYMCCNVYKFGDQEITESYVTNLLTRTPGAPKHLFWVGHAFPELYGVLEEGVYLRKYDEKLGQDMVHHYPDPTKQGVRAEQYYHAPVDWIVNPPSPGKRRVSWSVTPVGAMFVSHVLARPVDIKAYVPPPNLRFRLVDLPLPREYTGARWWIPLRIRKWLSKLPFGVSRKAYVYWPWVTEAEKFLGPSLRNGATFSHTLRRVQESPSYKSLKDTLEPFNLCDDLIELARNSVYAAFFCDLRRDEATMLAARETHGDSLEGYNTHMRHLAVPVPTRLDKWDYACGALAATGIVALAWKAGLFKPVVRHLRERAGSASWSGAFPVPGLLVREVHHFAHLAKAWNWDRTWLWQFSTVSPKENPVFQLLQRNMRVLSGELYSPDAGPLAGVVASFDSTKLLVNRFKHVPIARGLRRWLASLGLSWLLESVSDISRGLQIGLQALRYAVNAIWSPEQQYFLRAINPFWLAFEEGWKRIPYVGLPSLIALEFFENFQRAGLFGVLGYLPTALMHVVAAYTPFHIGWGIHMIWNIACLCQRLILISIPGPTNNLQLAPGSLRLPRDVLKRFLAASSKEEQTDPEAQLVWPRFRQAFYETEWEDRPSLHMEIVPTGTYPISLTSCFVPKEMRPFHGPKPFNENLELKGSLNVDHYEPPTECVLMICVTNVPFYYPGRSNANMMAVLNTRICAATLMGPEEQRKAWKKVKCVYTHRYPTVEWTEKLAVKWIEGIDDGAKRTRARTALEHMRDRGWAYQVDQTELMVKTNEALIKFDENGRPQMKPRPIANVSPLVQIMVAPLLRKVKKNMKREWPFVIRYHTYHGRRVSVTYASGATPDLLSGWMDDVMGVVSEGEIYTIVMGDDVISVIMINGIIWIMEGDATQFDASQSVGPLFLERVFLNICGLPPFAQRILERVSEANYVARSTKVGDLGGDRIIVVREDNPCRDTGGPDTSEGNSTTMGTGTTHTLHNALRKVEGTEVDISEFRQLVEKTYAGLGFDMKISFHRSWDDPETGGPTFLKGMWLPTPGGRPVWSVLPSRILKMGKCHRDPVQIYKKVNPGIGLKQATRLFMADLASSYSHHREVPLIGEFYQRWALPRYYSITLAKKNMTTLQSMMDHVKMYGLDDTARAYGLETKEFLRRAQTVAEALHGGKMSLRYADKELRLNSPYGVTKGSDMYIRLDREGVLNRLCARYKVPVEMWAEASEMVLKAKLFSLMSHPLFTRLALVDYA